MGRKESKESRKEKRSMVDAPKHNGPTFEDTNKASEIKRNQQFQEKKLSNVLSYLSRTRKRKHLWIPSQPFVYNKFVSV